MTLFIENKFIDEVDAEKGKFRNFLLASFKHYLANEHKYANALKRGGGKAHFSIHADDETFELDSSEQDPDKHYEREWAVQCIQLAMNKLAAEMQKKQKSKLFDTLSEYLTPGEGENQYEDLAEQLGISLANVKVQIHRLRQRLKSLIVEELRQTVDSPEHLQEEIRDLMSAFE